MSANQKQTDSMELFGQIFPVNGWMALIAFIVGLTVFSVFPLPTIILGSGVEFNVGDSGAFSYKITDGKVSQTSQERLLVFWTPSPRTKEDIVAAGEQMKPYYDSSLDGDPEGRNKKFAEKLIVMGAKGYNRFEVYGQGTSKPKHGYLWRLTSEAKDTRLNRENFVRAYSEFWGRTENIYVEEYDFSDKSR